MVYKYVIFKDDDVGKNFDKLKKWIDVVVRNDVKGTIGLIGKYLNDSELKDYLNSLNPNIIEIFCHGYSHSFYPFLVNRIFRGKRIIPAEFEKNLERHNNSLIKYRELEKKYLDKKALAFGPPGNIWNENVADALIQNDFKMIFAWKKVKADILTIPLSDNLNQNSFGDFNNDYEKNKDNLIYTLQFHHAKLSENQFNLMEEVIDFLKNKEKRIFVTPTELFNISKKDKVVLNQMSL